jgi:hypothetical protein
MKFAIALTALNLVVSGTTLAVILIGARKAKTELVDARDKANSALDKVKFTINSIEI